MDKLIAEMRLHASLVILGASVVVSANLAFFAGLFGEVPVGDLFGSVAQAWYILVGASTAVFCAAFVVFWHLWSRVPRHLTAAFVSVACKVDAAEERAAEFELQLEAERETLNKRSNTFAAMSHELRSPLNGVIAITDLLRRTPLSDEQRKFIKLIHGSGKTLLLLINDLLDISKLENGMLELDNTLFNGKDFLAEVTAIHRLEAERKGVEFHLQAGRGLDRHILADRFRIQQVLQNVLSNAVKFTEKGRVEISARLLTLPNERAELVFEVSDTGIGMTPEQSKNVFIPFAQADRSITRRYGGTGLGMPIAKQLCEAMEGWITVESAQGEGTSFKFGLSVGVPIEVAAPNPPKTDAPEPPAAQPIRIDGSRAARALIVAQSETHRKLVEICLGKLGVQSDVITAWPEVYDARFFGGYDLLLLDLSSAEKEGLAAVADIRRSEVRQELERIPMAALIAQDGTRPPVTRDIDGVLRLPMRPTELYEFVDRFVASLPPVEEQIRASA